MTPIKKNRPTRKIPTPDDVIAGASATSLEIVRMIHTINPTDRPLKPHEIESRYSTKSKLQSILIRRFSDSIIIDPPPPQSPDIVSIRLKFFTEDACHARIDTLDRDAAAIVRRLLRESQENSSRPDSQPLTPPSEQKNKPDRIPEQETLSADALIDLGRKAIESYDFDEADRLLTQAYDISGGIDALRALIEFYVERYGRFSEAVEIAQRAGQAAMRDPHTARLVTLAAAHIGRFDLVIDALSSPAARSADACLKAFRHLRDTGDFPGATAMFQMLEKCDDAAGVLTEDVRRESIEMQSQHHASIESALRDAWHANRLDEAESLARTLQKLKPQHALAGTVLHAIESSRNHLQFIRLTELAREAKQVSDWETAIRHLQEAAEYGTLSAEHREWITEAQRELEARADESATQAITALVAAGQDRDALRTFSRLKPDLRDRIRPRLADPRFEWLDDAIGNTPVRDPDALVDAILILPLALDALDRQSEPHRIERMLEPLQGVLGRLPAFQNALGMAHGRVVQFERDEAVNAVHSLDEALRSGDIDRAENIRRTVALPRLDGPIRATFNRLTKDLDARLGRRAAIAQFERLSENGKLFEAITVAETLKAGDAESGRWDREIEALRVRIAEQWEVRVLDGEPPACCTRILNAIDFVGNRNALISEDSLRLVIVATIEERILIRVMRTDLLQITSTVLLRTPRPAFDVTCFLTGSDLYITASDGFCFVFSIDSMRITRFFDAAEVMSCELGEESFWIPHNDCLWLLEGRSGVIDKAHIINVSNAQIVRTIPLYLSPEPFHTKDGPLFIDQVRDDGMRILDPEGRQRTSVHLGCDYICYACTCHPEDNSLITLTGLSDMVDWGNDRPAGFKKGELRIEVRQGDRIVQDPMVLTDSSSSGQHSIHASRSQKMVFVRYCMIKETDQSDNYLEAFKATADALERMYRVQVPRHSICLADYASNHVMLLYVHENNLKIVRLDESPPVLCESALMNERKLEVPESLIEFDECNPVFNASPNPELPVDDKPAATTNDPDSILNSIRHNQNRYQFGQVMKQKHELVRKFPNNPKGRLFQAENSLKMSRFDEAIETLDTFEDPGSGAFNAHVLHLLGIAYFAKGNIRKAIDCWREGEAIENASCNFESLISYAHFCALAEDEQMNDPDRVGVCRLFTQLRRIRDHLKHGEPQSAADAIAMQVFFFSLRHSLIAFATETFNQFALEPFTHFCVTRIMLQAHSLKDLPNDRSCRFPPALPPDIGNWTFDDLKALAENRD